MSLVEIEANREGINPSLLFANLDHQAGKAVRSRHCPATVMRNETGNKPLPNGGKAPA
jgi:hypothetical protein